ncbi:phosphate ABC transporter substrate-binding protein PstS [Micrococcoides hystricis]|uniref:Phosphate-binding protein n=1 Tax=Micrococcoides hystricis TaxID=1572761 RepID=A0ABV6PB52_9MICC
MKVTRFGRTAAVLSIAALALTACGSNNEAANEAAGGGTNNNAGAENGEQLSGTITGGGASSQESAMTAWGSGFQSARGPQVNYAPVGSGSGRKGFLAGEYQFAGTDSALADDEQEEAKQVCGDEGAYNIPVYISPIAVAFNLEGVDTVNMDAATIAKVFSGEITSWDDEAIKEQNPDAELPSEKITVVHRSDESGTTKNFTDYLNKAAEADWKWEAEDAWPSEITAESAQQTTGVVSQVKSTPGAITYADASAVGELGTVAVKVGENYQEYSPEAAAAIVDKSQAAEGASEKDLAIELDRTSTEEGTYPIVLVSYHVFCSTYKDQETVDLVKAFGEYVISEDGQNTAAESAHNAPISNETRERAQATIDAITVAE